MNSPSSMNYEDFPSYLKRCNFSTSIPSMVRAFLSLVGLLKTHATHIDSMLEHSTDRPRYGNACSACWTEPMGEFLRIEEIRGQFVLPSGCPLEFILLGKGKEVAIGVANGTIAANDRMAFVNWRRNGDFVAVGLAMAATFVGLGFLGFGGHGGSCDIQSSIETIDSRIQCEALPFYLPNAH
jgi:hypothetical protein